MLSYDPQQHIIYSRILYDGPQQSGKRTSLHYIAEHTDRKRGIVVPPSESGLHWLRIFSGSVEGYPLRCDCVVTPVPARLAFWHTMDVLIFVLDSSPPGVAQARILLDELMAVERDEPLLLVVQANVQDHPDALPVATIRQQLNLQEDTPLIPSCAHTGDGVETTLLAAIRLIHQRLRHKLETEDPEQWSRNIENPEQFYHRLRDDEMILDVEEACTELLPAPALDAEAVARAITSMTQLIGTELDPFLPALPHVDAASAWPAEWRNIIALLPLYQLKRRDDLVGQQGLKDGSGKSDAFIYQAHDWVMKTSQRRCTPDYAEAVAIAQKLATSKEMLRDLCPPQTAIVLTTDRDRQWWVWTITPWFDTLRSRMNQAADQTALGDALIDYAEQVVQAIELALQRHLILDVHPSNYAHTERGIVYIDDDVEQGREVPMIGFAILRRIEEYATMADACERYIRFLEQALGHRLTRIQCDAIHLDEALSSASIYTPQAELARDRLLQAITRPRR